MTPEELARKLVPPLNVRAEKWEGGWELEIEPDLHYTQVASLSRARQQVVDYLDTLWPEDEAEHAEWDIRIVPDVSSASRDLERARAAAAQADAAREKAAAATRDAVLSLKSEGVSQSDIAYMMGVSRARVSNIVHGR